MSDLSRRQLLSLLLGSPLAAAACRFLPRTRVPGQLRGATLEVGHRLRGATLEQLPGGPVERVDVAIVGAGPTGLSAAWRLERRGAPRFLVLELEAQAGGTSAHGTDGVVPYPWGAHYVPLPTAENPHLVGLLRELGAVESGPEGGPVRGVESALVRAPEERLFLGGRWHEGLFPASGATEDDLRELERFTREMSSWAGRRGADGRRAFTVPVDACSTDAEFTELDRISAADYLARGGYRSERLRWYVDYACRDDYGLRVDRTSAWAMVFYFAARLPAPGAPAAPFITFPEGNGRLVDHLAAVAGARLRTRRLVTDVVPKDDAVHLSVLDVDTGTAGRVVADRAILCVPQFVAARILRPFRDAPPPHLAAFTYGAWMVSNLHLASRPRSRGFPFAWDNVLHDSPSLGYVVATHQRLVDHGPTIWTYYLPFVDDDPAEARRRLSVADHAGYADAVLADLGRAHEGLEGAVERLDVFRWGHAMVRPVPGLLWGEARRRARVPVGRVHFAHSDLSGVALFEEAHAQGIRAADEVLAARGRDGGERG